MAQAPGHRLGQIIGETLELAAGPPLQTFAEEHGLYLDTHGERPARSGKKVTWKDNLGNSHDLDHVLERGGSSTEKGLPVAFIETAWRRYTKHSRNKAQEIQGAILPLLLTWGHVKPFAGVILAGEWTKGSLEQLRSNGFSILFVPYASIVAVFKKWGIDVFYKESTDDAVLQEQIDRWEALTQEQRSELGQALRDAVADELLSFLADLENSVLRRIKSVSILALRGEITECDSVPAAIKLIQSYTLDQPPGPLHRFEVIIRYDNDDRITADFGSGADAIDFLSSFR